MSRSADLSFGLAVQIASLLLYFGVFAFVIILFIKLVSGTKADTSDVDFVKP